MAKLYELVGDFNKVFEYMEDEEIDIETLENTLECIECEIEEKAENYGRIIKNLTVEIDGLKAEEERLSARRKSCESKVKWLKDNLFNAMKAMEKMKIKTELFNFSISKNPPSVKFIEGKDIPSQYLIPQQPKVDTGVIKELLKSGEILDFAELTQGESLRIR